LYAYMRGNLRVLTFTSAVVSEGERQTGRTGALRCGRVEAAVTTVESCSQTLVPLVLCVQQTVHV